MLKRAKGGALSVKKYPLIKSLATLSLAPKRSLALVEVCDQWLLVGVGTENVSLISKFEKPDKDSQFFKEMPMEKNSFDAFLSKTIGTAKKPESKTGKNEP